MEKKDRDKASLALSKYIVLFSASYAGMIILLQSIIYFFNLNLGSGGNIGILIAATIISVSKFVKDHKRVPTKAEKVRLIWFTYISSIIVSSLLGVIIIMIIAGNQGFTEIKQLIFSLPFVALLGIFLFITIVYYIVLNFIYGKYAMILVKQINNKKNNTIS